MGGRAECAGALGGDMRGVCDLQIEIGGLDFGFGSDTPCHAYGKGGGSLRAFRRAHLGTMKIEVFFGNVKGGKIEKNSLFW